MYLETKQMKGLVWNTQTNQHMPYFVSFTYDTIVVKDANDIILFERDWHKDRTTYMDKTQRDFTDLLDKLQAVLLNELDKTLTPQALNPSRTENK